MNKLLLGYNKQGQAVYTTDIENNPFWFKSMSSFTDLGAETARAMEQVIAEGQVQIPYEEILRSDKEMLGLPH